MFPSDERIVLNSSYKKATVEQQTYTLYLKLLASLVFQECFNAGSSSAWWLCINP